MDEDTAYLWQTTPLILSAPISRLLGVNAFLKFENVHPSHSYKFRGMSLFVREAIKTHGQDVHFVTASGGNAGLAVACAANAAGAKCTVYLPEGAAESTMALLRGQNAEVAIAGKFYLEAFNTAKERAMTDKSAIVVPAYDDPILWEGHSSMITETFDQLKQWSVAEPDAICCSVGGGGMLAGIMVGCKKVKWDHVPIVALETMGSNCFHHSILLNSSGSSEFATKLPPYVVKVHDEGSQLDLAHFNSFHSKASGSLGASQPATGTLRMALERRGGIRCVTIPDELSMQSAVAFANDHKALVELACSTTLSAAYKPQLLDAVVPPRSDGHKRNVVFIVCGGFKVSLGELAGYEEVLKAEIEKNVTGSWGVVLNDGQIVNVDYILK
ncbi:tryptophan synthase beta subunit-like PLP-dependent enzyme [Lentinula aciculospora]|uniref:L-serine ammonia-lyase n=1 Tax=Lentinula aciculospora TaxID=153920 RepID=A0A9W9ASA9_9AGAR|nr:tryptophan synthase beta subunit-like PLP-dependent enzyme [Lentinula aciculospora]